MIIIISFKFELNFVYRPLTQQVRSAQHATISSLVYMRYEKPQTVYYTTTIKCT